MSPVVSIVARLAALHPKLIDLSLDRMWRILDALGHPERALPPVIHVAGTNGKGSTIAFMRAILEAAGLCVHVYTSPHLVRFNERFRLGVKGEGRLVSDDELRSALAECERVNAGAPITVFEITTAAGLLLFSRHPADVLLLEVGLGGRLDATNVIDRPLASVITPVSLDHAEHLGDSLGAIAGEKAGILKRDVPAIVAAQPREALAAIERQAARVKAPIRIAGEDWMATEERGRLVYQDDDGLLDLPAPKLYGRHQFENAGVAIAALRAIGALEASARGLRGRHCQGGLAGAHAAPHAGPARGAQPRGQRALARRRPQRRRRARHRQCARRSRGAGLAPARARGRHARDQGLRELPAEFHRACPPRRGGADPAPGEKPARRRRLPTSRAPSAFRRRAARTSRRRSPRSAALRSRRRRGF